MCTHDLLRAAAIDDVTGALVQTKLTASHEHIRSSVQHLPGQLAVTYELPRPLSGCTAR
jgi:hypothetical protein